MDRVTQLQDAIDQLATMFFSSIGYLSQKSGFEQVNPSYIITQTNPISEEPSKFNLSKKELARDICTKAKQIMILIDSLPGLDISEDEQMAQMEKLNQEIILANEEHQRVKEDARELLSRVKELIEVAGIDKLQLLD